MGRVAWTFAWIVAAAGSAWAQGGGGGGGGGGGWGGGGWGGGNWQNWRDRARQWGQGQGQGQGWNQGSNSNSGGGWNSGGQPPNNPTPHSNDKEPERVRWETSPEAAFQQGKNILVYVYPTSEPNEPSAFQSSDVVTIVRERFTAIKMAYARGHPDMAALGVNVAPVLIAADRFGNEFKRIETKPSSDGLKSFLKTACEQIERFQKDLKADFERAKAANSDSALREIIRIATTDKKGYPEIDWAKARVEERARSRFEEADRLLKDREKEGRVLLENMIEWFKGTEHSGWAKLRLAKHLLTRGETAAAIRWLRGIEAGDSPVRRAADETWNGLIEQGYARLREQLRAGVAQGLQPTRDQVTRILQEYENTEVAAQAKAVLSDLGR